jgi:hypothetical protein
MWEIKATDEYEKRLKHYQKKHPRESAAVLNNLDTYHKALSGGTKPKQATFGFVHPEPCDVVAIDQKRAGPALAQTRLYVYPDATRKTLYLITLGDKKSQHDDIRICKDFVANLAELERESDDEDDEIRERLPDGPADDR